MARRSRQESTFEIWPGYVDALATLLMVISFILMVFVVSQGVLSNLLVSKDDALSELNEQIQKLSILLGREKENASKVKQEIDDLRSEKALLSEKIHSSKSESDKKDETLSSLQGQLEQEKDAANKALSRVQKLIEELAELNEKLNILTKSLNESEKEKSEQKQKIVSLKEKLDHLLSLQKKDWSNYRSEFFGRLKEALKDNSHIIIRGDRFIFQSEILFPSGSADLTDAGKEELKKLATILKKTIKIIPSEIQWVLRIDGHTDANPIHTSQFKSNWHLSVMRAISVVNHFIEQGLPAPKMAAAGFGEFQPVTKKTDPESLRKNRRIEIKLDQK